MSDEIRSHNNRDFGDEHIPRLHDVSDTEYMREQYGIEFDDPYEGIPEPPEAIPYLPPPDKEIQELADIEGLEEELLYTDEMDQRAVLFHRVERARVATWAFMQERDFEPHTTYFQTEANGSHDRMKVTLNEDFLRGMGKISLSLYEDLASYGDIGRDMADDIIQEVKTQYDPDQKLIY